MSFPNFGNPPAEFQGLKKQPKSSNPESTTVRSFLSHLTSMRRTLAFVVILFQVLLGLYLTRTFHISRVHSPKQSPDGESRMVLDVSSKNHGSLPNNLYGSLPNKQVESSTSNTLASLPNNQVLESSTSNTLDSLPIKEVQSSKSNSFSGLPIKEVQRSTSNTFRSLPNKKVQSSKSNSFNGLPNKEVQKNTTSKTLGSLPNKEVQSSTSNTFGSLPNKEVQSSKFDSSNGLPNKEVQSTTSNTFGSLPNKQVESSKSNNSSGSDLNNSSGLPNKQVQSTKSNTSGSLPHQEVQSSTSNRLLPNKEVLISMTSNTFSGLLSNKDALSTTSTTSGSCESGQIYVYDLPSTFNQDLLNDCNELDPWHNKCDKNLNDGFGPEAEELAKVVPESTLPAWYWTDVFWGEVVYHNRMLNYKCRTLEPKSATAFYMPFYAGLALSKYLWGNYTGKDRDQHSEMLINWVQKQQWWNRSNGSDHFIMLGRITWDFRRLREDSSAWGSSLIHMPEMKNVVRLSVERDQWDEKELAVPYPTVFHPRSDSDIAEWQSFVRRRRRNHLFTFVGGPRKAFKNDFRRILLSQCLNKKYVCRHVDCDQKSCNDGNTAAMEAFLDSSFCLQPRGNGYTRPSVFDCMLAGSIPVFFWRRTAYLQYKLFLPSEPESYSVFIHRDDVRNGTNIRKVLRGYGKEEVRRMRERVIEAIPRFVYAKTSLGLENSTDAFDIAIDGVLEKIQGQGSHKEQ